MSRFVACLRRSHTHVSQTSSVFDAPRSYAEEHQKPNMKVDYEHVRVDDCKCVLPFLTNTKKICSGDVLLLPMKSKKRKADEK